MNNTMAQYVLVAGKFNRQITERLVAGARAAFEKHGVDKQRIECIWVPGAFEIPMVCQKLISAGKHQAIIALGAVIRGETPHFDFVAGECARGIAQLNLQCLTPIIFGVLTTDTPQQAIHRADPTAANKGAEFAYAAIEMVDLMKRFG